MRLLTLCSAELQIREGIEDKSKIIFISHQNICCDSSLEPSQRDGSNGASQNTFLWRNMANNPCYPLLSGAIVLLC